MAKYKAVMLKTGIMQKEVLTKIQRVDPRVDKPLLSKIVNDICLPNKHTLECICKTLRCNVLDLYDIREIELLSKEESNIPQIKAVTTAERKQTSSCNRKKANVYNLTVELDRLTAMRVLSKNALKKLGYDGVTDFVRKAVEVLIARLEEIENKGD